MAAETPKSTLEILEDHCYDTIRTAESQYAVRDALTELGFIELQMEPEKLASGLERIWTGMHGRSGLENLGILATTLGVFCNTGPNPLTVEYAVTKARAAK